MDSDVPRVVVGISGSLDVLWVMGVSAAFEAGVCVEVPATFLNARHAGEGTVGTLVGMLSSGVRCAVV